MLQVHRSHDPSSSGLHNDHVMMPGGGDLFSDDLSGLGLATSGAQLRTVRDDMEHMLTTHPARASDAPSVHLAGPGDTWFELEAAAWFTSASDAEFQTLRDQLLLDCLDILASAGVALSGAPAPTPSAPPGPGPASDERRPNGARS